MKVLMITKPKEPTTIEYNGKDFYSLSNEERRELLHKLIDAVEDDNLFFSVKEMIEWASKDGGEIQQDNVTAIYTVEV